MTALNKLRWRCRRGTLELDMMLMRYLEHRYPEADELERQTFLQLLDLEDSELMRYLMGERVPTTKEFVGLVTTIRSLPAEF